MLSWTKQHKNKLSTRTPRKIHRSSFSWEVTSRHLDLPRMNSYRSGVWMIVWFVSGFRRQVLSRSLREYRKSLLRNFGHWEVVGFLLDLFYGSLWCCTLTLRGPSFGRQGCLFYGVLLNVYFLTGVEFGWGSVTTPVSERRLAQVLSVGCLYWGVVGFCVGLSTSITAERTRRDHVPPPRDVG